MSRSRIVDVSIASAALSVVTWLAFSSEVFASHPALPSCEPCEDGGCQFTMPEPDDGGIIEWITLPTPKPGPGSPGDGDCDPHAEPPPDCDMETPCDVSGTLKFQNKSSTTVRFKVRQNGNPGTWQQLASQQVAEIEFDDAWYMDCGYRGDDESEHNSSYTIEFEYLGSGGAQWFPSSAGFSMSCTVCPRWSGGE